ncbi:hypothetical protein [Mycolicibacterium peregrinum]|nr:hypothetical protein [Mycolicibacterium peregrinum]
MTYPPGPQGPWPSQQPPQPPYGYGAPQQPYPGAAGYGIAQQSYPGPAAFGPAQGPFGAPPPYGYPMPPQPSGNGKRTWLILGGVAGVALLLGAVLIFGTGGLGFSSDERAIAQLFKDMSKTDGSISAIKPYFCAADQKMLKPVDTSQLENLGIDIPEPSLAPTSGESVEITDLQINGDTATAKVKTDSRTDTLHFRKEGGKWKVCMSDDPSMPRLS